MNKKRLVIIFAIVGLLLLIPLIAMQFTNDVDWKFSDFLIMGILLSGTALLGDLVICKVKSLRYRIIMCCILLILFFLIWAEFAVGLFGTPIAGS